MNKHDNGIKTPQRNSTKKKHNKTILKGMTLLELEKWCLQNKQPQFRGIQIYEWMYNHGESNAESKTNLGENFRGFFWNYASLNLSKDVDDLSVSVDLHFLGKHKLYNKQILNNPLNINP